MLDTMRRMHRGTLVAELAEVEHDVIAAVRRTMKPGEVTVTLRYALRSESQVEVTCKVKDKAPEFDKPTALFFVDDENQLHRDDPRQETLELAPAAPARAQEV